MQRVLDRAIADYNVLRSQLQDERDKLSEAKESERRVLQ